MAKNHKSKQDGDNEKLDLSKLMPTDLQSLKILNDRASILSKVEKDEHTLKAAMTNYVKFVIGSDEYYGIPYEDIQDVRIFENITRLPNSPAYITGVSYWHGKIIPLIDLGMYLGLIRNEQRKEHLFAATVSIDKSTVAFIFNAIVGIDAYLDSQLDNNIPTGNQKIKDLYILGIHSGTTVILNVRNIITAVSNELKAIKRNVL